MRVTAIGFAVSDRLDVTVSADVENEIHFELRTGLTINGAIVDRDGHGVGAAQLLAAHLGGKHLPVTAVANSDGTFTVSGLQPGKYLLRIQALGFLMRDVQPVLAGSDGGEVVLHGDAYDDAYIVSDYRLTNLQTYGAGLSLSYKPGFFEDESVSLEFSYDMYQTDDNAYIENCYGETKIEADMFTFAMSYDF